MRTRTAALALTAIALLTACENSPDVPATQLATAQSTTPADTSVRVRQGELVSRLTLSGAVEQSDQIDVLPGPHFALDGASPDRAVAKGETLGEVKLDDETAAALAASGADIDKARLEKLRMAEGTLKAPTSGQFKAKPRPHLITAGSDAVAPLAPLQRLRLESDDFTARASVETVTGVRDVECLATWIADDDASDGEPSAGQVRCRLPHHIETAAGLRVTIFLTGAPLSDVVLVPNIYVGYDKDADTYVVTIIEDSSPRTVPVTVGATDGVMRAILTELPVGAQLVLPASATDE